jgi:hypothetical protein
MRKKGGNAQLGNSTSKLDKGVGESSQKTLVVL